LNSISDSTKASKNAVILLPSGFTWRNYVEILKLNSIFNAFGVSVARTIIGSFLTVIISSMFAYALTKNELTARKQIYRITVLSMYINAGLIPWYIIMYNLGMKNNFLAYVLPGAVNVYLMILVKTYIEQIPPSLEESAIIDGAGYMKIFWVIIFPLCKPVIAAISVFSAVGQWNSWQDNFFLISNKNLQTLQLTLLNYLRQSEALSIEASKGNNVSGLINGYVSPMSIRMTITMVVAIPVIMVYPFLQRYFIKGIMMGAIKG
jgi:ABC-type sugar transport system, permease component